MTLQFKVKTLNLDYTYTIKLHVKWRIFTKDKELHIATAGRMVTHQF